MLTQVIQIIQETFSPSIEVTGDTAIKNDLQLDSFEIINLISILEERFGIEIDETEISFLVTINDICDYLTRRSLEASKSL